MNSSRRVRSRDLDMNDVPQFVQRLLSRLHAYLPLAAYPRPILLASLRGAIPDASTAPCCIVTNVFYAGDEHGIMCQLEAPGAKHPSPRPLRRSRISPSIEGIRFPVDYRLSQTPLCSHRFNGIRKMR